MSVGPAIFRDRDGAVNLASVRNGKLCPPASLADLELDQAEVAIGKRRREVVEAINGTLTLELRRDDVRGASRGRARCSSNPSAARSRISPSHRLSKLAELILNMGEIAI